MLSCQIEKIADLFGCTPEYLLEGVGEPIKFYTPVNLEIEDLEKLSNINKIFRNLSEMEKILKFKDISRGDDKCTN